MTPGELSFYVRAHGERQDREWKRSIRGAYYAAALNGAASAGKLPPLESLFSEAAPDSRTEDEREGAADEIRALAERWNRERH